jgi:ribosomal protein S6
MSQNRQYELVYIVSPDASDEAVAELHTQIEQIVQRYNGASWRMRSATRAKARTWSKRSPAPAT